MNQLKEAEKKATLIVQEARKARGDRMKEAKSEAEKIIANYRAEMEATYQVALAKSNSTSGTAGSELEASTNSGIKDMQNEYEKKKQAVEKMLIQLVLKVDTTVPKQRVE
eukprot:gene10144-11882_t